MRLGTEGTRSDWRLFASDRVITGVQVCIGKEVQGGIQAMKMRRLMNVNGWLGTKRGRGKTRKEAKDE